MPETPKRKRGISGHESLPLQPVKKSNTGRDQSDDHPERVIIDRNGDLLLNVPPFKHDGKESTAFLVASKCVSLSSLPLNAMLNGKFTEGQTTALGLREVSLTGDDPSALMVLLNICHLRFNLLPKQMPIDLVYEAAVLSDKYDVTAVMKPFVKKHYNFYKKKMLTDGDQDFLFIAWAFGLTKEFRRLFNHYAHTSKWGLEINSTTSATDTTSDDILLNAEGEGISDDLPPDVCEAIVNARSKVLLEISLYCDEYWKALNAKLTDGLLETNVKQCYAMEVGSLISNLAMLGLFPAPTAESLDKLRRMTVSDLILQVKAAGALRCDDCMDDLACRSFKENIAFTKKLDAVHKAYDAHIPEPILKHLQDQEAL